MFDDVFEELVARDAALAALEEEEEALEAVGVYRLDRYRSRPAPPPPPPPPKRSSIFYFEPRDYPPPLKVIWIEDVRPRRRRKTR